MTEALCYIITSFLNKIANQLFLGFQIPGLVFSEANETLFGFFFKGGDAKAAFNFLGFLRAELACQLEMLNTELLLSICQQDSRVPDRF